MRRRISLSLDTGVVESLDREARRRRISRSRVIERLLEDSAKEPSDAELRSAAEAFFAGAERGAEPDREDWSRLATGPLIRED